MKKTCKVLLAAVLAVGCLFLSGCGDINNVVGSVSQALQADGRKYGQTYEAEQNESLKSEFFEYSVKSAKVVSELPDGSTAEDEDDKILIVEVAVENIFREEIPMFSSDFELVYDGMTDDYDGIPLEEGFLEDQFEDSWDMPKGDSQTGTLLFIVPSGVTEFGLKYLEIWEDDFEGNTYTIHFTAEDQTGTEA